MTFKPSLAALVSLASCQLACTFYTNAPGCDTNPNNPNGNAGSTAAGGSSTAGSGNQAGSGPAPSGEWVNVTSNLADIPSECGNLGLVAAKPDEDLLIAGISLNGLWSSVDGGDSWSQLGDSEAVSNRITTLLFDPDDGAHFWETGAYNGAGIFETTDDGQHFEPFDVHHIDTLSVDFSDPDRQTMIAGGHEQPRTMYLSVDGGAKWKLIGDKLPGDAFCNIPLLLDTQTFLVGCYGGHNGILRSEDAGDTWESVSDAGGGATPLVALDGTIYWAAGAKNGFVRSTDGGKTWSDVMASDLLTNVQMVELPDHRIAAVGKQAIMVSSDQGDSWQAVTTQLPFGPFSLTYSSQRKAFYTSYFTCGASPLPVPANAIARYDYE